MAIVGTLTVDLVMNTASFEGTASKASGTARRTSKEIQDSFNGMKFGEARGGLMLIDDLIGVHMPRHAAAFVSQIPGFAAAFNAMFPVAAAAVATKAIFEAFEAAKKHREELENMAQASVVAAAAIGKHADALHIQNLKTQDAISLLEHKLPQNGLVLAMLEGKRAVDDLIISFQKAIEEESKLEKNQEQGFLSRLIFGDNGSGDSAAKLAKFASEVKELQSNLALAESRNDSVGVALYRNSLNEKLGELRGFVVKQRGELKATENDFVMKRVGPETDFNRGSEARQLALADAIALAVAKYKDQNAAIDRLEIAANNYGRSAKEITTSTVMHEQEGLQRKIAFLDQAFNVQKALIAATTKEVNAGYQVQFDQGQISATKLEELKQEALDREYEDERNHLQQILGLESGKAELIARTNKQIETLDATHAAQILGTFAGTLKKNQELEKSFYLATLTEYQKDEEAFQSALSKKNAASIKAATELEAFNVKEQQGRAAIEKLMLELNNQEEIQNQRMRVATGLMTEQQAAQETLAKLDKNKTAEMITLNALLDQQRSKMQKLSDETGGGKSGTASQIEQYQKSVLAFQAAEQKKLDTVKSFSAQENQIRLQAANTEQSQWRKMALEFGQLQTHMSQLARQSLGQMNSSMASFIVTGQGSFRQLAVSAGQSFIEMALEYVESKTIMKAIDALFGNERDKDKMKAIAGNVALAASAAALSAANTLALTSAMFLPPIPEGLASAAYAEGMIFSGLASAARGALLPGREMLVHTHPEEMILPQNISNFIVNAANNSSGGGGGVTHNYYPVFAPTLHAVDADGVDRMLKKHGDRFHKEFQSAMRRMNF